MEHIYKSYYTNSDPITSYMVNSINIKDGDIILEPSAGEGVFIDKILNENKQIKLDAYDINPKAIETLKNKYLNLNNIKILNCNTLLAEELDQYAIDGGWFDKIIGNPPYGGWLDIEERNRYKSKYEMSGKETYTLFLARCISLLKNGGQLSFIVPDTYLFLHRHVDIRKCLLTQTKIKRILIFPSKLFPGVQFGYSNLSIITLEKCDIDQAMSNTVEIISSIKNENDIRNIDNNENLDQYTIQRFIQSDVFNGQDCTFYIKSEENVIELLKNTSLKLGDIADCVTGIYTGNNVEFMKVSSKEVKNSKLYDIINPEEIAYDEIIENSDKLVGLDSRRCYIPIIKGASAQKYIRNDNEWYVNWSKDAIREYKERKKSRFQNSQFYFKKGIAIPMVKSSKLSATIMENRVFDQSIVGVFPTDKKYFNFILGLLNSEVGRKIIYTINPSANNSANYIKKIPIILPSDSELQKIDEKINTLISNKEVGSHNLDRNFNEETLQLEIEEYYRKLYYGV